jgi:uncharacterized protein YeaO (DUF488 family)
MKIQSGSLQKNVKHTDGLRICVMRRIKPSFKFDMWVPNLAPSEELLQAYVINKDMSWEEFKQLYTEQVINNQEKLIKAIVCLSNYTNVTILCWEKSQRYCHRSLLIKACLKVK